MDCEIGLWSATEAWSCCRLAAKEQLHCSNKPLLLPFLLLTESRPRLQRLHPPGCGRSAPSPLESATGTNLPPSGAPFSKDFCACHDPHRSCSVRCRLFRLEGMLLLPISACQMSRNTTSCRIHDSSVRFLSNVGHWPQPQEPGSTRICASFSC